MNLLYRWVSPYQPPPRWMAFTYRSIARQQFLFVAFPFNYIVCFVWWAQDVWAQKAYATSWIEREVERRLSHPEMYFAKHTPDQPDTRLLYWIERALYLILFFLLIIRHAD